MQSQANCIVFLHEEKQLVLIQDNEVSCDLNYLRVHAEDEKSDYVPARERVNTPDGLDWHPDGTEDPRIA